MRARPSRVLERGSSSDLWRHTLSQIPTIFGRLVYLSGVRDTNTGRYQHHGLSVVYGEAEADRILRLSHDQSFQDWLGLGLREKKVDLNHYLATLLGSKRQILETWARLQPYRSLAPTTAASFERQNYEADIHALLSLLMNEHGVAWPDKDA